MRFTENNACPQKMIIGELNFAVEQIVNDIHRVTLTNRELIKIENIDFSFEDAFSKCIEEMNFLRFVSSIE